MFIADIPYLKCFVRKEYLRNLEDSHGEYIEAYAFAVTSMPNKPLLFTVHTVDGAVVSRLPMSALVEKPCEPMDLRILQLWSCLSANVAVIEHAYLKNYKMKVMMKDGKIHKANYLWTLDSRSTGFSEHSDQHKTFNVGWLDSGQLMAQPNNRCLFLDSHFVNFKGRPDYKTNTHDWHVEDDDWSVGEDTKMFYESKKEELF